MWRLHASLYAKAFCMFVGVRSQSSQMRWTNNFTWMTRKLEHKRVERNGKYIIPNEYKLPHGSHDTSCWPWPLVNSWAHASVEPCPLVKPSLKAPLWIKSWVMKVLMPRMATAAFSILVTSGWILDCKADTAPASARPMLKTRATALAFSQSSTIKSWNHVLVKLNMGLINYGNNLSRTTNYKAHIKVLWLAGINRWALIKIAPARGPKQCGGYRKPFL